MKTKYKIQSLALLSFLATQISFAQETTPAPSNTAAVTTQTTTPANTQATTEAKEKPQEDEGAMRHVHFGIRITPSYNTFNVLSKTMKNDGGVVKFGAGLLIEKRLTKNVELQTGLGVDVFGGKIIYTNDPSGVPSAFTNRYIYNTSDEAIIEYDVKQRDKPTSMEYMLMERTYKINYITLPVNLRMKTNDINGFKYFLQLGFDFQFRWSAYASDKAQLITGYDTVTTQLIERGPVQNLSKVKINEDVSLMNVAVNTGIGAQYTLGGVDLFLALNYKFGIFSPVHKESDFTNKVYQTSPGKLDASKLKQEYRTRMLTLTLGFMF